MNYSIELKFNWIVCREGTRESESETGREREKERERETGRGMEVEEVTKAKGWKKLPFSIQYCIVPKGNVENSHCC